MTRVIPAPDAQRIRCAQCGTTLGDREAAENTAQYGEGIEMAVPFCSDTCAMSYRTQEREDIEEFEEIYRAGAT